MLDPPLPLFHSWLWIRQPWFECTFRSLYPWQQLGEGPLRPRFLQVG